jgi:ureidoglycolate hydrolase
MKLLILELTQESFESFGRVLEPLPGETPEVAEEDFFNFFVIFKEFAEGWQIGYLEQIGKVLKMLECHPTTPEVFIPLRGEAILLLAINPEEEITAFKLDKPIVLTRGIWHGVISLSKKSEILIVENENVTDKFYSFREPLSDKSLEMNSYI